MKTTILTTAILASTGAAMAKNECSNIDRHSLDPDADQSCGNAASKEKRDVLMEEQYQMRYYSIDGDEAHMTTAPPCMTPTSATSTPDVSSISSVMKNLEGVMPAMAAQGVDVQSLVRQMGLETKTTDTFLVAITEAPSGHEALKAKRGDSAATDALQSMFCSERGGSYAGNGDCRSPSTSASSVPALSICHGMDGAYGSGGDYAGVCTSASATARERRDFTTLMTVVNGTTGFVGSATPQASAAASTAAPASSTPALSPPLPLPSATATTAQKRSVDISGLSNVVSCSGPDSGPLTCQNITSSGVSTPGSTTVIATGSTTTPSVDTAISLSPSTTMATMRKRSPQPTDIAAYDSAQKHAPQVERDREQKIEDVLNKVDEVSSGVKNLLDHALPRSAAPLTPHVGVAVGTPGASGVNTTLAPGARMMPRSNATGPPAFKRDMWRSSTLGRRNDSSQMARRSDSAGSNSTGLPAFRRDPWGSSLSGRNDSSQVLPRSDSTLPVFRRSMTDSASVNGSAVPRDLWSIARRNSSAPVFRRSNDSAPALFRRVAPNNASVAARRDHVSTHAGGSGDADVQARSPILGFGNNKKHSNTHQNGAAPASPTTGNNHAEGKYGFENGKKCTIGSPTFMDSMKRIKKCSGAGSTATTASHAYASGAPMPTSGASSNGAGEKYGREPNGKKCTIGKPSFMDSVKRIKKCTSQASHPATANHANTSGAPMPTPTPGASDTTTSSSGDPYGTGAGAHDGTSTGAGNAYDGAGVGNDASGTGDASGSAAGVANNRYATGTGDGDSYPGGGAGDSTSGTGSSNSYGTSSGSADDDGTSSSVGGDQHDYTTSGGSGDGDGSGSGSGDGSMSGGGDHPGSTMPGSWGSSDGASYKSKRDVSMDGGEGDEALQSEGFGSMVKREAAEDLDDEDFGSDDSLSMEKRGVDEDEGEDGIDPDFTTTDKRDDAEPDEDEDHAAELEQRDLASESLADADLQQRGIFCIKSIYGGCMKKPCKEGQKPNEKCECHYGSREGRCNAKDTPYSILKVGQKQDKDSIFAKVDRNGVVTKMVDIKKYMKGKLKAYKVGEKLNGKKACLKARGKKCIRPPTSVRLRVKTINPVFAHDTISHHTNGQTNTHQERDDELSDSQFDDSAFPSQVTRRDASDPQAVDSGTAKCTIWHPTAELLTGKVTLHFDIGVPFQDGHGCGFVEDRLQHPPGSGEIELVEYNCKAGLSDQATHFDIAVVPNDEGKIMDGMKDAYSAEKIDIHPGMCVPT